MLSKEAQQGERGKGVCFWPWLLSLHPAMKRITHLLYIKEGVPKQKHASNTVPGVNESAVIRERLTGTNCIWSEGLVSTNSVFVMTLWNITTTRNESQLYLLAQF